MELETLRQKVGLQLLQVGCIKFGEFKLKSGIISPIYIDLRILVSFPSLMRDIAQLIVGTLGISSSDDLKVCGVPYTALPIATAVSFESNLPMLMIRKEPKDYGTKKLVEGVFQHGDRVLLIEDVVTTGGSIIDVAQQLTAEGLLPVRLLVLVDREMGATPTILAKGYAFSSLFTISELLAIGSATLDPTLVLKATEFLRNPPAPPPMQIPVQSPCVSGSFGSRAKTARHPSMGRLLALMEAKQSNLCVAVDTSSGSRLLEIADAIGPHVAVIKTHCDILEDWSVEWSVALTALAEKHNFLVFEDRKFADIGTTVRKQFKGGPFFIERWASLITVHGIPGQGIVDALNSSSVGIFLLAQMSSQGNLADEAYSKRILDMACQSPNVIGLITNGSARLESLATLPVPECGFIHATPGIQLDITSSSGDALGQRYNQTPSSAVQNGSDLIIVGRGIVGSDPDDLSFPIDKMIEASRAYQLAGWSAYLERIHSN